MLIPHQPTLAVQIHHLAGGSRILIRQIVVRSGAWWRRDGLRVREASNDEGTRLLWIVRRNSESAVTWRRAPMPPLSVQGRDVAEIAKVTFTSPGPGTGGDQQLQRRRLRLALPEIRRRAAAAVPDELTAAQPRTAGPDYVSGRALFHRQPQRPDHLADAGERGAVRERRDRVQQPLLRLVCRQGFKQMRPGCRERVPVQVTCQVAAQFDGLPVFPVRCSGEPGFWRPGRLRLVFAGRLRLWNRHG